ncbi:hypothetical protein [Lactococcus formosensis]|uniref:hypothetical protein n=1 Tax=Lactococcus formosensis TaxID=1281486 RepID=UPI0024349B75|nr:hypothetical protein [Lactococcus formosensis]MDG6125086.1 hypothetical protein [Lactococcus formosensis]MDG6148784.1 hypothetical protein [Lactococcus formosensis]
MATSTFTNAIKMNNNMVKKFDGVLSKSAPLQNTMATSAAYKSANNNDILNLRKALRLDAK